MGMEVFSRKNNFLFLVSRQMIPWLLSGMKQNMRSAIPVMIHAFTHEIDFMDGEKSS